MTAARVLHVTETAKFGISTYLNSLFSEQVEDFENVLLCPDSDAALVEARDNLRAVYFRRTGRNAASLIALARAVRRVDQEHAPDIIHAHSTIAGLIVRIYATFFRTQAKIVYSPHGWAFQQAPNSMRGRTLAAIERILAFRTDSIINISRFERDLGLKAGIESNKLHLVYNGIPDCANNVGQVWPDERLKIIFVGRLDYLKGIDILLKAIEGLESQVAVRLVGGGFLNDFELGPLPDNVELLGLRPANDIHNLMGTSDVVVVPSRWEGLGLVAIEALRAGRPVIASSIGGLPEVVEDGVSGLLFRCGSPESLREAILKMLQLDLASLGKQARQRFEQKFLATEMIEGTINIYSAQLREAFSASRGNFKP